MQKIPMTFNGAKQLRDELERLKRQERPKIVTAISEARALGDLKENAEYHAAKERQGLIEGRIQEIEYKLACANIIDLTKIADKSRVFFAATVTIKNLNNDEENVYQIVGEDEATLKENKISINSPLVRALLGKTSGDTVVLNLPVGTTEYVILKVEYCF